ncbi:MAG: type II secretion system protein [Opitutaceae bacterium]
MTSATGSLRRRSGGFTLIEIIMVIGLIAFAGAMVVSNFASMADRGGKFTTEETLRAAIRQARFVAGSERMVIKLRFDDETGELLLSSGDSFPLGEDFINRGEIRFYMVPPAKGLSSFTDPEKTQLETDAVSFAPDRSSSPFVVEIDSGSGSPERIAFDPFSSLRRKTE